MIYENLDEKLRNNYYNYALNYVKSYVNYVMTKQIKSKQRVADHGEVFTREQEVNVMLDLVKDETLRIESPFS